MIARPPEKKFGLKIANTASFFAKVANDNHPPKRIFLGWVVFLSGVLLLLGAAFWIYEKATFYYRDATQWWTDEQYLNKEKPEQISLLSEIDKLKDR